MTNECIVCYSDSAKSICSRCTACTCITCYKKLTHCPQCRSNNLKSLNFIKTRSQTLKKRKQIMRLVVEEHLRQIVHISYNSVQSDLMTCHLEILFDNIIKLIKNNKWILTSHRWKTILKSTLIRRIKNGSAISRVHYVQIFNETF